MVKKLTFFVLMAVFILTGTSSCLIRKKINDYQNELIMYSLLESAVLLTDAQPDSYEPNDSYTSATTLKKGVPQTHTIHSRGADEDYFAVSLVSGNTYTVETDGGASGTCSLDTEVYFYGQDGTTYLNQDSSSGFGECGVMNLQGYSTGTYYVRVYEFGHNEGGSYRITFN